METLLSHLADHIDVDKAARLIIDVVAPLMGYMAVSHLALYVVAKVFWPDVKDHWNLADSLFCVPFYAYMAYLAVAASSECIWSLDGRWDSYTPNIHLFFSLYVARNLFHIPFMLLVQMKPSLRAVMMFHHALSSVCYFGGLYTQRMGCYGAFDGICEVTSVFLSLIYLFKELHWDKSLVLLHTINGLGLWVGYIFTRLLLFPTWLYLWYIDVTQHTEQTWDKSSDIERYLYPATNVVLLYLSTMWMVPITKGLVKALRGMKNGQKEKPE